MEAEKPGVMKSEKVSWTQRETQAWITLNKNIRGANV